MRTKLSVIMLVVGFVLIVSRPILAHHGTNEHGSPVEPQTLEALIVHSLDTLDAHAEIMRAAWLAAAPNANLIDAPRPLKGKLARSLKRSAADG